MKKLNLLPILAIAIAITFGGCKKTAEEIKPSDAQTKTAADDAKAQQAVTETFSSVNNYGINDSGIKSGREIYITIDSTTYDVNNTYWPRALTIDFDQMPATVSNGRSGKIRATFNMKWNINATVNASNPPTLTVEFINYKVNGVEYLGKITVKNLTTSITPTYNMSTDDFKLKYPDASTIQWHTNRTIEWISGYTAGATASNAKFKIKAGSTNGGVNSGGVTYEASVKSDLVFDASCTQFPITEGKIDITQAGATTSIDFGSGTCDKQLSVTLSGITVTVNL